jgi:hypothetical protein
MDTRNPWLSNLVPFNARRGEWTPTAWREDGPDNQPEAMVTVTLPGEQCRSRCLRVVSSDALVVRLGGVLLTGKGHDYRAQEIVPVRREVDGLNGEIWRVVSERELENAGRIERFEAVEAAKAKAKAEAKEKELAERAAAQGLQPGEVGAEEELARVVAPERKG